MKPVLVTGAAGNVGQHVARSLLATGVPVIAAGRDPTRAEGVAGDAATVRLDFWDRGSWAAAFDRAGHMFLMRPPAISDVERTLCPFIDAAREQGIDHIVFLSVAGADRNKWVPHRKVEDHLRSRGNHFTNLRPGFFAQNLESAYREDIMEDDRIYVPAGRKQPVNWIDARDIAEVAARVLTDPIAHRGQSCTLTGPRAVPWEEVTGALSANLGRTIRYQPASIVGYMRHLSRRGLPRGAVAVQTLLHVLLRFGQGAAMDPTLAELLGRPARSIHEYIRDHAAMWAKPTAPTTAGASSTR